MIKAAAVELFAERGFQATPTVEIAKRAGVSEGVVFYHFQTKEGILISLFEDICNDFNRGVRRVLELAPCGLEAVLNCLRFFSSMIEEGFQEMLVLMRDMPSSFGDPASPYHQILLQNVGQSVALLAKAVEQGRNDGTIRQCDPNNTAYLILGIITGMCRMRLLGVPSLPKLEPDYLDFCRRALAPDQV